MYLIMHLLYYIFIPFCVASEHSCNDDEVLEAKQQDDMNEGTQDNSGRQSSLHPCMQVLHTKFYPSIALGFHQQLSFIGAFSLCSDMITDLLIILSNQFRAVVANCVSIFELYCNYETNNAAPFP